MSTIGYARVSTRDQNPDYQKHALLEAGAERVFIDHGDSSRVRDRPQWLACLEYMRPSDTLLVHRLDRVSGEWHLFQIISDLGERGINIRSLTEPAIDTTTPMGRAFYGIVAVFAQLRIDTIRENTMAGLAHARSQGRIGGRPTVMTPERIETALLLREDNKNIQQIAKVLGVGRMSVSRALAKFDGGSP
ncbi:DNA-invertase [Arthrobacter sp. Hiyo1]|uniref:recombinase family protein n=1 Tax=Arthrobacter sp. Hiyo1 TaxID=1588020 RepID=UPI0006A3A6AD|nr:recombinase family protein [Arthrobacter sp. Hiyo1]GAP61381.1 DNA-invertase [Arthrobacter sp. Hiyo1]